MIKRAFLSFLFLSVALPAYSAPIYLLEFDLFQGDKIIDRGKTTVTSKSHTWNRGLTKSYLKLRCNPQQTGKTEKLLSTVDLFSGLMVSHKLEGEQLAVNVKYSIVKPRLVEIRALQKNQCEDLVPTVSTTTEVYNYAAKNIKNESRKFGENMSFRVKILSLGKTR